MRMKRKLASLLCAALVLSLCACGKTEPLPRSLSAEEQLAESGIALYPPITAEEATYWMVKSPTNGKAIPEVTFIWQENTYQYRAERTDKTEPYDFTGLDTVWTEEGSFGDDDREGVAFVGDDGGYLCWVDDGVAYLVMSTDTNDMFALFDVGHEIATMDAWGGQMTDPDYVDDGEITESVMTPAEQMEGVWRYDSTGTMLRIGDFTYQMFDAEGAPVDEVIRFWDVDPADENTIVLRHENGETYVTLTLSGEDWNDLALTNGDGETLHRWDGAPDGMYYAYMAESFVEDGKLYLMDGNHYWLRDETVAGLQVGDTVELQPGGYTSLVVEELEKLSDTAYRLDPWTEIHYDSKALAWQVIGEGMTGFTLVGNVPLSRELNVVDEIDHQHTDLQDCLEAHGSVYAHVEVVHGEVKSIDVTSEF